VTFNEALGQPMAMLYATVGRRAQAHTVLTMAIAMYRAVDMTFWLPQVGITLTQVG
jgi:hypothetical protein